MTQLRDIEKQAEDFAKGRHALSDELAVMEEELRTIKRKHLPVIRRLVATAQKKQDKLKTMLEQNPELFEKPRTHTFHGIKLGYQKGPGKMLFSDEGRVIKLIKKRYGDEADHLIKTTEKPIKSALGNLMAADLKKLGITIVQTADSIVLKPTDTEIDKLVDAMLKDDELELAA